MTDKSPEQVAKDVYYCMNCWGEGDIRAADAPNGHRYWVCEECEPNVKSGDARVIWRQKHVQ